MKYQARLKLVEARAKKCWTLEKAAEEIGVSKGSLLNWEKGKTRPFAYNVELLCKAYGMTAEELGLAPTVVEEPDETEATSQLSREKVMESTISHLEPLPISLNQEEKLPSHFLNAQDIVIPTHRSAPHLLGLLGIQSMLRRQCLQQIVDMGRRTFFTHT